MVNQTDSLKDFCNVKMVAHYIPDYDMQESTPWYGIKALWYEGAKYQGKKTKVFALIGYPKIEADKKAPAMVLVHGGGGHPYAEWIRRWNDRGYIAIAMDTTGFFPGDDMKGLHGTEAQQDLHYHYVHELYGDLAEEGYTLGPDNNELKDYEAPIEDQWMYHAVSATILAHNILRQDPLVDTDKVGITGISWGGVITSIAMGYDPRYAFAIPIYGSGYLDGLHPMASMDMFAHPIVKENWSAAKKFSEVPYPILWLCYCNDTCFCFRANSLSYQDTKQSGAYFANRFHMGHSHVAGWKAEETYRFAECMNQKKVPLIKAQCEPTSFGHISFDIEIPCDFQDVSAELYYVTDPIYYNEKCKIQNEWHTVKMDINNKTVSGMVPDTAYGYYVEFQGSVGDISYISTTAWVEK